MTTRTAHGSRAAGHAGERGHGRGVALAVMALGAWAGAAPFVVTAVPAFDRLAMAVVPGAVALLGGAGMALGRERAGAAVALAGGTWLALATLAVATWPGGPFTLVADSGAPLQRLQWLILLFCLGGAIAALALYALAGLTRPAVRPSALRGRRPATDCGGPRMRGQSAAWRDSRRVRGHAPGRRHVRGDA